MGWELDKGRCALLLLDFQHDFAAPGGRLGPEAPGDLARLAEAVSGARRALEAAREEGLAVFHVPTRHRPGHPDANARSTRDVRIHDRGALVEGSPGAGFLNALAPRDDEALVVKRGLSALVGTDLVGRLNGRGIDTVLIAGIGTHLAVESTARQAVDLGYGVVVLEDACASADAAAEEAALAVLADLTWITDVATAVSSLITRQGPPPTPEDSVEIIEDYDDLELIDEEDQKVLRIFEMFDADGNGSIDRAEFAEVCEALGGLIDGPDLDAAFDAVDVDGSGTMDFQEFLVWWRGKPG